MWPHASRPRVNVVWVIGSQDAFGYVPVLGSEHLFIPDLNGSCSYLHPGEARQPALVLTHLCTSDISSVVVVHRSSDAWWVMRTVTVFSSRRTCSSTPSSRNSSRTSLITSSITDLYNLGWEEQERKHCQCMYDQCLTIGSFLNMDIMVSDVKKYIYI